MRQQAQAIAAAVVIADRDHDVRWVAPENLHVTLKFLGEVGDAELPAVMAALRTVPTAGPLRISTGLPDPKRHRGTVHLITAQIIDVDGGLGVLRESIEQALEPLGFAREKRAFWPHLTIGRSRRGVRINVERFSARGAVGAIDRFELMSSTLRPGGSLHVRLASFPLAERE